MDFFLTWPWALLVILSMMNVLWVVSVLMRNASIVDLFWGVGFVLAVWVYFLLTPDGLTTRKWLVAVLTTIWGLRLSLYLTWRNWGRPEDFRYQAFRRRYGPERYWWVSLFQVFLLQGVLLWLVSAPLLGAQLNMHGGGLTLLDWLAAGLWLVGFTFEAVGDWQLARFKADPDNAGKLLTSGLWRYTRHPNYFGDACVWWAFGLFSLAAGSVWPVLGSVLMTILLLRVSGVSLLERTLTKSKPGYEEYQRRTNAFFPWFPRKSDSE